MRYLSARLDEDTVRYSVPYKEERPIDESLHVSFESDTLLTSI